MYHKKFDLIFQRKSWSIFASLLLSVLWSSFIRSIKLPEGPDLLFKNNYWSIACNFSPVLNRLRMNCNAFSHVKKMITSYFFFEWFWWPSLLQPIRWPCTLWDLIFVIFFDDASHLRHPGAFSSLCRCQQRKYWSKNLRNRSMSFIVITAVKPVMTP